MDSLWSSPSSSSLQTPLTLTITFLTLITLIAAYLYSILRLSLHLQGKKIPAGSFGFPVIGESISFLRACKQDKIDEWLENRIKKYGAFFKTSLFGSKFVVLSGQIGSRLVFQGGDNGISYQQPKTVVNIIGKHNLFELTGVKHKVIRGSILGFFKPESIQRFVSQIDLRVEKELLKELEGKDSIKIVDLMKKIAFSIAWSTFFGFPDGIEKDKVLEDFKIIMKGLRSIPVNFPGTGYNNALKARARLCKRLSELVMIKKQEMEVKTNESFLSELVNLRDENGEPLAEDVILDNILMLILASHDTVAVLLTLFIRHLSRDKEVYNAVVQEQMEVMKAKRNGRVSWKEIKMMKYTWRVAQELMRLRHSLPSFVRQTTRDINFEGLHIPKGWQEFDPSRFENSKKNYPPYTYLAFGAGPRICPGAEFGRIEAMLVIHHFVTKYEWKEMAPDESITINPMPYPSMGLPVRFHFKNNH